MSTTENNIINNEQGQQFEYIIDGKKAFIRYSRKGKNFLLEHTEVPEEMEGHGVAREMVEKTFAWLEQNSFTMSPLCPYIFKYVKRHPAWKRIEAAASEE